MESLLAKLFNESFDVFLEHETENILFDVAERNLCGRLAIYITSKLEEYKLDGYYADPEYNRKQGGRIKTILDDEENVINIQCDLIIHSRGEIMDRDNLVAIEMKKATRPEADKESDRKRLRAMTKDKYDDIWSYDGVTHPEHVCGYIWGFYLILDKKKRQYNIEVYKYGKKIDKKIVKF